MAVYISFGLMCSAWFNVATCDAAAMRSGGGGSGGGGGGGGNGSVVPETGSLPIYHHHPIFSPLVSFHLALSILTNHCPPQLLPRSVPPLSLQFTSFLQQIRGQLRRSLDWWQRCDVASPRGSSVANCANKGSSSYGFHFWLSVYNFTSWPSLQQPPPPPTPLLILLTPPTTINTILFFDKGTLCNAFRKFLLPSITKRLALPIHCTANPLPRSCLQHHSTNNHN